MRPQAVLLDFFNTLAVRGPIDDWIRDTPGASGLDRLGFERLRLRLRNVWAGARALFPDLDWDLDPAAHREVFIAAVRHGGGVSQPVAIELYEAMLRQLVPNPGALEFVGAAGRSPAKLAIVSNTGLDIRPCLERCGIAGAFDAVVLSFEVGCVKPNPRIFELAASALGADPAHCVMIGDSAAEDGGAAALGMMCRIERPDEMRRAFNATIESLGSAVE